MLFHRSLVIIAFEHSIDSGFGGAEQLVIAVPGLVRLHRGGEFGEHALERLFLAGLHAQRGDHTDGTHRNPPLMVGRPRWGRPDRLHQKTSNRPAAPWPPPMHMVTTAYLTPRRLPSMRAWPTQRAPVMPKGWPIEIEPPLTLSSSFGMPS